MKLFVLIVFILVYVLILAFPKYKVFSASGAALLSAGGVLIAGVSTFIVALSSINYNVILMLLGIMITVGLFSESGMPNRLADKLMSKIPNALSAVIIICILSGLISALIDNVATVLMLAPIGMALAKKAEISPVPVIIGIAVSSNLQGAATLVGDTTSIMLGDYAGMSFMEFFFLDGKISIFWAVELGMLLTIPVLYFIFRKENKRISITSEYIPVTSYVPTILLLLNIVLLIATSFIDKKPDITNGIICMVIGIIGFVFYTVKFKTKVVETAKKLIDYETILFLLSLFVLIFAVEQVGIIADISKFFAKIGSSNVFLLYTLIVVGSVFISAFIDNIPYVATMLPVISSLCVSLPGVSPYLLYFGLLIGATLGGNITPVGASANVVGIGILRKEGYNVTNKDFFKIGIPFTLVAVLGGYVLTYLVWGL